jgi:hypothetical protein
MDRRQFLTLLGLSPFFSNLLLRKALAAEKPLVAIATADAVATTLFGLGPEAIATTVAAYRRGLGEMSMAGIRILRV